MIELPIWVVVFGIGIIFFLIIKLATLSEKLRKFKKALNKLEGLEVEEVDDSKLGTGDFG